MKIRNMKVTWSKEQSKNRRETPTGAMMPSEKRRKMDITRYMRVLQGNGKKEKRKEQEEWKTQTKEEPKRTRIGTEAKRDNRDKGKKQNLN